MNVSPSQKLKQEQPVVQRTGFKIFNKNQVQLELRPEFNSSGQKVDLDVEEYILNHKHSNSEGLPEIDRDSQNKLINISDKEREHYTFLNNLKTKFNVDQSKLINLECRLSGKLDRVKIQVLKKRL